MEYVGRVPAPPTPSAHLSVNLGAPCAARILGSGSVTCAFVHSMPSVHGDHRVHERPPGVPVESCCPRPGGRRGRRVRRRGPATRSHPSSSPPTPTNCGGRLPLTIHIS